MINSKNHLDRVRFVFEVEYRFVFLRAQRPLALWREKIVEQLFHQNERIAESLLNNHLVRICVASIPITDALVEQST